MASHVSGQNQINDPLHAGGMTGGEEERGVEGEAEREERIEWGALKDGFKCSIKKSLKR